MKKFLSAILVSIFALTALTACGGTEITLLDFIGASTEGVDLEGRTMVFIGETFAEEALIDEQVKANTTLYDCILERFEEINKRYNCNISYQTFAEGAAYEERFAALIYSGACPADIIYGDSDSKLQVFTEAGFLTPLTSVKDYLDYEDSAKFGTAGLLEAAMVNGVPHAVQPCYWPGFQNNYDYVLVYNPTLTTEQGLPDLHEYYENGTWTWDAFSPMIENYNKAGEDEVYATMTVKEAFAKMAIASNGVKGVDYIDGVLRSDISTPKAIRSVEWMQDLLTNNKENILLKDNWELDEFIDGRVMTALTSTPNVTGGKLQYESSIKFGIMPFPSGPDATYGEWAQYTASIRGFAIPFNSEATEASARIINDLCEPFEDFGGEAGLADYFNTNVFFSPIDTEIFLSLGENIRYTYWRTGTNLQLLFTEIANRYDLASATEILSGFEPKLQDFIDNLLKANYENYLHEHLYGDK